MRSSLFLLALAAALVGCPRSAGDLGGDTGTGKSDSTESDADTDADSDADGDTDTDTDTEPVPNDTGLDGFLIVINEINADPGPHDANCDGKASSTEDEFVEIVNAGPVAVDLGSATLADTQSIRHVFPFGTILQPNDAVVVFGGGSPSFGGVGASPWCVDLPSSVRVQLASEGGLSLNNDGDTLTLTGPFGGALALDTYGVNAGNDQSVNRSPELQLTDFVHHDEVPGALNPVSPGTLANGLAFADVQTGGTTTGGGTTGTPTVPADYSGLVINEILADPAALLDANCDGLADSTDDEYVEVVNTLPLAVDVGGVQLSDGVQVRFTFMAGTVLEPGGTVVVFAGGSPQFPGVGADPWCQALPADVVLATAGATLSLNNTGDTVSLLDPAGALITSYAYGAEGGDDEALVRSPEYTGAAMVAHSTVSAWTASPGTRADGAAHDPFAPPPPGDTGTTDTGTTDTGTTDTGTTDTGTTDTGTTDTGTTDTGVVFGPLDLVVNEILADPAIGSDANCDGTSNTSQDEFIELHNRAETWADLENVTISDSFMVRHTFPAGTVLEPGGTVVLFSGGTPVFDGTSTVVADGCVALPTEVLVQTASSGSLGLNNTGDTVTVADPRGVALQVHVYDAEGGSDSSLNRSPELDPLAPFVLHTTLSAVAWSPGTRADGSSLSGAVVVDTGTVDTGTVDTGTVDTGTIDTGTVDTGTVDTGTVDTGTVDTGTVDTGTVDTGTVDTGLGIQAVVLHETFDDDLGFTKTDGNGASGFFSDGAEDYWGISDGTTGGDFDGGTPPNITGDYSGFSGSVLVMQDLNGDVVVDLPAIMTWSAIDILGLTNVEVSVLLAEALASDAANDIDNAEYIILQAVVDGVLFELAEFRGDTTLTTTNGLFRVDTDGDGIGDGPVAIGPAATEWVFPVPVVGASLDLILQVSVEAGDEDLGVDDLKVLGTP
jgi:Lamin Tail Domain